MTAVKDVMTSNPVTVSVDTHATKVRSILRTEEFRCVPVVSKNHLVGVITRGDILNISSNKSNIDARGIMERPKVIATPEMNVNDLSKKLVAANELQAPVVKSSDNMDLVGIVSVMDLLKSFLQKSEKANNKTVSEFFTSDVVTCNHDDSISFVWNKMDDTGYSGLPVIKNKKMIGIITRKDIINSGHVRIIKESDEIKRSIKVEKIMKTPPIIATPDMKIHEATDLLVKCDIGRLPVVKNPVYIKKMTNRARESDLIGIIAREDILESYLN
ncbi:MAG: CBS domain-containing protein [Methanobacteriaceae archaeon]